jgi:hypothetical protein
VNLENRKTPPSQTEDGAPGRKEVRLLRSNYRTSLAALLAVGAELSRRGYDVAFTLGNTPRIDLLASVPDGRPFKVQVKGISKPWGFFLQKSFLRAKLQRNLYLVVVIVARQPLQNKSTAFRFFVLSHGDAKKEGKNMRTPYESGLNWGSIKNYENEWGKFPPLPQAMKS